MPGIVVFGRRWSAGSDDLVVPAALLVFLHVIWLITMLVIYARSEFDVTQPCSVELKNLVFGYIVILCVCLVVECIVVVVSLRGSILDTKARASMQYLLYLRIIVVLGEVTWLVVGIKWLVLHFPDCDPDSARRAILGVSVFNLCMILLCFISMWCTFDTAGRKWVVMKRYQESLKEKTRRSRRSGSARRNWRQRKAFRAYEESWDRRLGLMCCCVERKGRNKNSMSEIAQLFTEFFRDLDVVPSDVIAGLVLLRRFQKLRMENTIKQHSNDVYRYLSGIPVTPRTQFLQLGQPEVLQQYRLVIHYMKFAMAAYGWPIFMMMNTGTGLCKMIPYFRCCCCQKCCKKGGNSAPHVLDDNCCQCNLVALKKISGLPDMDLVYVTYHVDIGETPFFVALDNKHKKIVICVRGTLSLQDVLTDLKADAENIPLNPVKEDWIGHKGMVQAAIYIKKKLVEDQILDKAFEMCKERSPDKYGLVLVGHSLGAGTASILAIMLQQEYTDIHCYAYSPPGGLLSYECMEATKTFITSVVVGKDVVPRIGLPQMELLRTDIINIIKKSVNPKWKIISKALCCGSESASRMTYEEIKTDMDRNVTAHPADEMIGLTAHKPMFPPGRIILVVRNHPGGKRSCCGSKEPVYQAIWADNGDFQEVLVSPTMVNDHMPDNVMDALEKVLINVAPPKPTRLLSEVERKALLNHEACPGNLDCPSCQNPLPMDQLPSGANVPCNYGNIPSSDIICKASNPGNHLMNANGLGWDTATEEILLSLDRQHLFPGLGEYPRLELDLGTDWIQAPLATPEILSAASSMSALSRSSSIQKSETRGESVSISAKLETIQQSPDMKLKAEGSSEDLCDTVDNDDKDLSVSPSLESLECLMLKPRRILHTDVSKGSMNNLLRSADMRSSNECVENAYGNELTVEYLGRNQNSVSSCLISEPHYFQTINEMDTPVAESDPTQPGTQRVFEPLEPLELEEQSDDQHYERHSPDEITQCGYGSPNDIYSAGSVGYQPYYTSKLKPLKLSNKVKKSKKSSPKTPYFERPENKKLHYSQSESYLEKLNNVYTMKRSTEEGDIAHMGDSSTVFVTDHETNSNNVPKTKVLKSADSLPVFNPKILPRMRSEVGVLAALQETDYPGNESVNSTDTVKEEDNVEESSQLIQTDRHSEGSEESLDQLDQNRFGNNLERTEQLMNDNKGYSDKQLLLGNVEHRNSLKTEDVFVDSNSDGQMLDHEAVSPCSIGKPETRLFNSTSYHSASSFSGDSEKHLSSVSGQSDDADLPITETDV